MSKFFVVQDMEFVEYIGEFPDFGAANEVATHDFPYCSFQLYNEELFRTMLSNAQDALERSKQ